jgi:thiamine-phosphate pyrophosphorylase
MAPSDPPPVPRATLDEPRARLAGARLYLVCPAIDRRRPDSERDLHGLLRDAAAGGVDIVQLRDKDAPDHELEPAYRAARELCRELGLLFIVNDRPELAVALGADGVHVGQDDLPVPDVRAIVGPRLLIGLSTHAPAEIDDARPQADDGTPLADYIGVGPVHATPTKPGRPAVGEQLVRYAARNAQLPFFAIGGLDGENIGEVIAAGARRVCVLRAISAARDRSLAARALREELDRHPLQEPP